MQVQYQDPAKPAMINGEWRSAKCDNQARLELVIVSMPGASETGTISEQGDGNAAKPWYMQGVNAGTPERLATQDTLAELAAQGESADTITLGNLAVTTSPAPLPSIALTNGAVVSVKNPEGSGQTVFVGRAGTITAALSASQPTWPIAEGDVEDFGGANANEWYVCASGNCTIAYRVEAKS